MVNQLSVIRKADPWNSFVLNKLVCSFLSALLLTAFFVSSANADSGSWLDELRLSSASQSQSQSECLPGVHYRRNEQGQCVPVVRAAEKKQNQVKELRSNSSSECLVVKGRASTDGVDLEFAKKMAIRDALKNASMQRDLKVGSDITMQNQQLTLETSRFVSNSHVKSYTLLKGGLEDPEDMYGRSKPEPLNYEVEVEVCLSSERGLCPDLNGRKYFPRLLIAPLAVKDVAGARDIRNLVSGYQLELERRLLDKGQSNLSKLNRMIDIQPNRQISPNLDPQLLQEVYSSSGAQYLLLSVLRSVGTVLEDNGWKNQVKRHYDLDISDDGRYIEADWYLVDLLNKKIAHQARAGFDIRGKVRVGRERPFATNAFFATDTGKGFDALLSQEVDNVQDFLHCQRFESEIIDVRDGKYYLYLTPEVGAKVGDDLAVYHRTGMPVNFAGRDLGSEYQPGAFLKITAIHSEFAVAELITQKNPVQIGDRIRPW